MEPGSGILAPSIEQISSYGSFFKNTIVQVQKYVDFVVIYRNTEAIYKKR